MTNFKSEFKGKNIAGWWFLYLFFSALNILILTQKIANSAGINLPNIGNNHQFISSLFYNFAANAVTLIFFSKFYYEVVNSLSFNGEKFTVKVPFKNFVLKAAREALLVDISFGLYSPWAYHCLISYLASNTSYSNETFHFKAEPIKLFLAAAFCFAFFSGGLVIFSLVVFLLSIFKIKILFIAVLIILLVLMAFMTSAMSIIPVLWCINFEYKDKQYLIDTSLSDPVIFNAQQLIFTWLSLGLYLPTALINVYTYLTEKIYEKTELRENSNFELRKMETKFFYLCNIC